MAMSPFFSVLSLAPYGVSIRSSKKCLQGLTTKCNTKMLLVLSLWVFLPLYVMPTDFFAYLLRCGYHMKEYCNACWYRGTCGHPD